MFLNYDLLAQRWVRYAYLYPFGEALAGILMIAGALIWLAAQGGALHRDDRRGPSVFKAVYIDKRELKCACVGGSSRVPLGFVSLTENVMDDRHGALDGHPRSALGCSSVQILAHRSETRLKHRLGQPAGCSCCSASSGSWKRSTRPSILVFASHGPKGCACTRPFNARNRRLMARFVPRGDDGMRDGETAKRRGAREGAAGIDLGNPPACFQAAPQRTALVTARARRAAARHRVVPRTCLCEAEIAQRAVEGVGRA